MNGKRINMLRKEVGLTQDALAKKLGVGRTTVNGYENGIIKPPTEKINKMSEIFDVTTDYILGQSDSRTQPTVKTNDVAEQLGVLLNNMTFSQDTLTLNGEEMDEVTKELLIQSLKNSLELAKTLSKKK